MRTKQIQPVNKEELTKCPDGFNVAERRQWEKHLPKLENRKDFPELRETYINYCKSFCKAKELDKVIRRKGLFCEVSDGSLWRRKEVMEAIRHWAISSNLAKRLSLTTHSRNNLPRIC